MKKGKVVFNKALELLNKLLNVCKNQHDKLSKIMKGKINVKNLPRNLAMDLCLDEDEDEHEHENDLPPMLALDGDEEVKL